MSPSFVVRSAITPPLSFQHSRVRAPVHQIESGSESSPFSALRWLFRFFQLAERPHARIGSSLPLADGPQKCRRHVDRNRKQDSREFSLERTLGRRLL